jgi:hypothetical protein
MILINCGCLGSSLGKQDAYLDDIVLKKQTVYILARHIDHLLFSRYWLKPTPNQPSSLRKCPQEFKEVHRPDAPPLKDYGL